MNILLVMIPLSILFALGAGVAFFWAVDHDQFDDLDTPKLLPLLDEPPAPIVADGVPQPVAATASAPAASPTTGTADAAASPTAGVADTAAPHA